MQPKTELVVLLTFQLDFFNRPDPQYLFEREKTKNKSSILVTNRSTVVTIRGLKATEKGKPASVKVSFQVKKTGKASKYSYVSKVNVIDDKQAVTAAATGAKKVTVSFNKALASTTDVKIAIKKGTTELSQKAFTFTSGKEAVVELNQSLTNGKYTAEVTGLEEGAMTAEFDVDSEEYVATIELKSDKAPMEGTDGTAGSSSHDSTYAENQVASIGYVLKNQYGEVMDSNVNSITWTVSTGVTVGNADYTYKNGSGTLWIKTALTTSFIPGNEVFINAVLTNGTHVATMSGKAQIVLPAKFDEANIAGVYNKTLKKMDIVSSAKLSTTKNPYVYQLLFTAKDQYGNDMDADYVATNGATLFTSLSTNPIFIQTTTTFETVDVDGKTYVAMTLSKGNLADKGGTATIQLISSSTGTKSTYEIIADAAGAVDKFTLGSPAGYAVKGEKLEIPFTAVDQYGNDVTAYDALNGKVDLTKSAGTSFGFVKKTYGTAKLVIDLAGVSVPANSDLPVYLTSVVKSNGNYSSSSINVKEVAVPKSIGGIKASSKKSTTLVYASGKEGSVELTYKDIDVLDQYGRVMSNDDVKKWLDTATNSIVLEQASTAVSSAVILYQDSATTDVPTASLTNTTGSKAVITAQADGSEKIEFKLQTSAGTVAGSKKKITFSTATQKEFTSYAVDDLDTFYFKTTAAQTTHKVEPKVYGVKADGSKVRLVPAFYDITTNASGSALTVSASDGKIQEGTYTEYTDASFKKADGSYQDVTVTVTIKVKSANGAYVDTLTKEMKLSNKDPKVAVAKFASSKVTDGKASLKVSEVNSSTATNLNALLDADEVKDQYGVKNTDAAVISISNVEDANADNSFSVTTNDNTAAAITGAEVNDTFTVTYTWGTVSISVDIIVIAD